MMTETQIEAEITKLQKKVTKLSKTLYSGLKPEVKAKRFNEINSYQEKIAELEKQLMGDMSLYEKDYIKHDVPIKSNIIVDEENTTAVLKAREEEIINNEIEPISGTEVLFMDMRHRQREKDSQETLKNTIIKNLNQQTEPIKRKELLAKLEVITTNLSKLEASLITY